MKNKYKINEQEIFDTLYFESYIFIFSIVITLYSLLCYFLLVLADRTFGLMTYNSSSIVVNFSHTIVVLLLSGVIGCIGVLLCGIVTTDKLESFRCLPLKIVFVLNSLIFKKKLLKALNEIKSHNNNVALFEKIELVSLIAEQININSDSDNLKADNIVKAFEQNKITLLNLLRIESLSRFDSSLNFIFYELYNLANNENMKIELLIEEMFFAGKIELND
jgi:hypothetical protein